MLCDVHREKTAHNTSSFVLEYLKSSSLWHFENMMQASGNSSQVTEVGKDHIR